MDTEGSAALNEPVAVEPLILDFEALARAEVGTDPCPHVFVPRFVHTDRLADVNRDYPDITLPGNFDPEGLGYGPAFAQLIAELHSPEFKAIISRKLDIDLSRNPLQMTVRKWSEQSDGNVHVDSKNKFVTALIYFNENWPHATGRLRLCRNSWNLNNYAFEIPPEHGNLIVFKRTPEAFHGFESYTGERRSLQMYWVKPKRAAPGDHKRMSLRKFIKRLLKLRPR